MRLPYAEHGAIRAVGVARGLWLRLLKLEGIEAVRGAILFPPLHRHQFVGEQGIARRDESGVGAGLVERKAGVGFVPTGATVVANEVNGAKGVVSVNFADDPAQALTLVRPFLRERVYAEAVKSQREQPAVGRDVKAHALVHHRGSAGGEKALRIPDIGQCIFRENDLGIRPIPPVDRGHQQSATGRNMFGPGGAKVLQVITVLPESQVGLVVVGPAHGSALGWTGAISAERLVVMDAHRMSERAVVEPLVRLFPAHVANRFRGGFLNGRGHHRAPGCAAHKQQDCGQAGC